MKFEKEIKDLMAYCFAAVALLSGIILSFICALAIPPLGVLSDSVLFYVAQTLMYSGGVIGLNLSIKHTKNSVKNELGEEIKDFIVSVVQDKNTKKKKEKEQ